MSRPELMRLLDACKRHPEDDAARLVVADWLEEHGGEGDRARAELIRLQVPDPVEAGLPALTQFAKGIVRRHQADWTEPLDPLMADAMDPTPLRGLLLLNGSSRRMGQSKLHQLASSEAWAWVEAVTLWPPLVGLEAALESPLLATVPRLALEEAYFTAARWRELARSPGLAHLRSLGLGAGSIPAEGVAALASSPHLAGLRELSLFPADATARAVAHLEGRLPALEVLNLCGIPAGELRPDHLLRVLARPALRELDLRTASLTAAHVEALAESARLPGLRRLWLSKVEFGPREADALAALAGRLDFLGLAQCTGVGQVAAAIGRRGGPGRLRSLLLWYRGIGPEEARALGGWAGRLATLDLSCNPLGPEGVAALIDAGGEAPSCLKLHQCHLDDEGVRRLARWPGLARCRHLVVSSNDLTAAGLRALVESPHLGGLLGLDISDNGKVGVRGLGAFLRSPLAGRLVSLDVSGCLPYEAARRAAERADLPRMRDLVLE